MFRTSMVMCLCVRILSVNTVKRIGVSCILSLGSLLNIQQTTLPRLCACCLYMVRFVNLYTGGCVPNGSLSYTAIFDQATDNFDREAYHINEITFMCGVQLKLVFADK